ncbi:hypothetical protein SNEBB_002347 [Seison nebaliae]|nr:hypothetical protein SNEBB_002347 [Seison nebaliae]
MNEQTLSLIDALPYVDKSYEDAGTRETAVQMIEDEMKRFKKSKHYLKGLMESFDIHEYETDNLQEQIRRIEENRPNELLNMKRYELPTPSKMDDEKQWKKVVDNSYAQLGHQSNRIFNLEMLMHFGPYQWREYCDSLDQLLKNETRRMNDINENIQKVNYQRKKNQEEAHEQLEKHEMEWVQMITNNFRLETHLNQLKIELANELRRKNKCEELLKEQELAKKKKEMLEEIERNEAIEKRKKEAKKVELIQEELKEGESSSKRKRENDNNNEMKKQKMDTAEINENQQIKIDDEIKIIEKKIEENEDVEIIEEKNEKVEIIEKNKNIEIIQKKTGKNEDIEIIEKKIENDDEVEIIEEKNEEIEKVEEKIEKDKNVEFIKEKNEKMENSEKKIEKDEDVLEKEETLEKAIEISENRTVQLTESEHDTKLIESKQNADLSKINETNDEMEKECNERV